MGTYLYSVFIILQILRPSTEELKISKLQVCKGLNFDDTNKFIFSLSILSQNNIFQTNFVVNIVSVNRSHL